PNLYYLDFHLRKAISKKLLVVGRRVIKETGTTRQAVKLLNKLCDNPLMSFPYDGRDFFNHAIISHAVNLAAAELANMELERKANRKKGGRKK
ncbi:MAG: hypothetical protein AAB590_01745, partial [Patescibacteria group bacterium]